MEVVVFILAVGIAVLSLLAFGLQTKNVAKVLLIVIFLLAMGQATREVYNLWITRPRPSLILAHVEEQYDAKPPTAALFLPKIENTGDAFAINVRTKLRVYVDNKLLDNDTDEQVDIAPGKAISLRIWLDGAKFARVWREQSKLRMVLDVSYTSESGREYSTSFYGRYKPYPDAPITVRSGLSAEATVAGTSK